MSTRNSPSLTGTGTGVLGRRAKLKHLDDLERQVRALRDALAYSTGAAGRSGRAVAIQVARDQHQAEPSSTSALTVHELERLARLAHDPEVPR